MMSYSVKIIIATHKKYNMPNNKLYLPLHVGAEGKNLDLGYEKDNVGDNISYLNASFCELTGLYWAWKNLEEDYIGLVHYRRHFSFKKSNKLDDLLTIDELKPYLGKIKVFVPKKRKYYIETLYSHYKHTHYCCHLDETKKIIAEKYPNYLDSCERVFNHTYGYMFNMMILEKKLFNDYCSWLFDILFELKNRMDMPDLSSFQSRYYGRVSEIIFNVWLDYKIKNKEISNDEITEIPYVYMEKINWSKKITSFLQAKFIHKKYESSF